MRTIGTALFVARGGLLATLALAGLFATPGSAIAEAVEAKATAAAATGARFVAAITLAHLSARSSPCRKRSSTNVANPSTATTRTAVSTNGRRKRSQTTQPFCRFDANPGLARSAPAPLYAV